LFEGESKRPKRLRNEIASALYPSNYKFLVASTSRAASRLPLQLIRRGAGKNFILNFNRR